MKKMMFVLLASALVITMGTSCKKKMSDADALKGLTEKFAKMTPPPGVSVKDGVVTLTGALKDDAAIKALTADVTAFNKDLKVENKCTVMAPIPASTGTNVSLDAAVQKKITDGLKDIKGASVIFEGKKAVFSGTFTEKQKATIQQSCMSAGVAADMTKATITK